MKLNEIEYNKKVAQLSSMIGVSLIAGTDTHALNKTHSKGRSILQASKNIYFENEDKWDLTFKTYEELIAAYKSQNLQSIAANLLAARESRRQSNIAIWIAVISILVTAIFSILGFCINKG